MSRDEIVALINTLWKLSEAMEDAQELTAAYWASHRQAEELEPVKSSASDPTKSKPEVGATTVPPVAMKNSRVRS